MAAKTKVAPLKQVTLARLEFNAAALLVKLASHAKTVLELQGATFHFWSDSMVTLGWIRGHLTRWKTYVANRVSEIQTTMPEALWHYVPGGDNPADCASRGLSPGELIGHQLWWQGPAWLKEDPSTWPASAAAPEKEGLPDERVRVHVAVPGTAAVEEPEELLRFSSLRRLLRVTAWCRRWLRRGRGGQAGAESAASGYGDDLSAEELEETRLSWIRRTQAIHFGQDMEAVRLGRSLPRSNFLVRLNPVLDAQGLLRVGGRLKHAVLAYDERHPVILPEASQFTRLTVDACYRRTLHGGGSR
ncbi:uncharacterized protein LOC143907545 [Temnothorax americanus]|uniref:uncharacterized protein LOC143907545 n=1 Tax=Temnothorax americanus TaxID=1964332 RepID=UPI0040680C32